MTAKHHHWTRRATTRLCLLPVLLIHHLELGGEMALISLASALGLFAASPALALGAAPSPHTRAAVIAADDAWLRAEIDGDAARLTQLLEPGYATVDPSGKVVERDALIAAAAKRGPSATRAAMVSAWRASHPTRPHVSIFGNAAVLTWVTAGPETAAVSSSDIFVFRHGAWHAIYSQHSTASS